MMNIINGGAYADNNPNLNEFMSVVRRAEVFWRGTPFMVELS
jgi:enolase